MTTRAPRPCAHPGCPNLVRNQARCPEHTRAKDARRRRARGPRVYDTQAWRRLRERKLATDPHCEMRTKCDGALATEVHHRDGDQWNLSWGNLVSSCKSCHSSHTAKTQGFARGQDDDGGEQGPEEPPRRPWTFA